MKADNVRLLDFIGSGKRTFYIPVYQRNYDWKKDQCVTLFRDIEKIATSSEHDSHFLGAIVYVDNDSSAILSRFTIIDGQQRLTSIMLLLKALRDATDDKELQDEIMGNYLINKRVADDALRIKLKPMKSDAINYQRLIDDHIRDMDDSQILSNYRLFQNLINQSSLTAEEIYQGVQKLEIVYIKLGRENPQLIFESLNSTGLDLTQADLIRNFLLMGQKYCLQEKLYNSYWIELERMLPDTVISDFIRDYLTLKTRSIPNKDSVYEAFKRYFLDNYSHSSTEILLDELKSYGTYYSWFKYCICPDEHINSRLTQIQRLKSTTVYPFLLSIFDDCYTHNQIQKQTLADVLDVLLSYFVRRQLCEMPTNALNKVFATMADDIRPYDNNSLCDNVAGLLAKKQGKVVFPSDTLVRERLLTRDSYKFPHIKYVLEQVERSKGKEPAEFDNLTIEHIMPRTLSPQWKIDLGRRASEIHEKYLNCIGNLTLTGYNSEMSNARFEEKRENYAYSNIYMNKEIAAYENWNEEEIISRTLSLAQDICAIWRRPAVIQDERSDTVNKIEFDITDEVNVTGRTPSLLELRGEDISVDSWVSFLRIVCTKMYDYDPQIFRSLLRHSDFAGRNRRIISDVSEGMRKPYRVAEGIYIETNFSANDVLNYVKLIIEKFDGIDKECSYRLKPVT